MAAGGRSKATTVQAAGVFLALLAAALLTVALPAKGRAAHQVPAPAPAEAIVRFAPGVGATHQARLVRAAGGVVTHDLHLIGGIGARMTPAAAARLRSVPGVRSVAFAAPVAPRATQPLTAYPSAVGASQVWNNGRGVTGRGVGVAVIDTGIDERLSDFADLRSRRGSRVIADAVVNPGATSPADGYGHGTHVAGIIAGNSSRSDVWDHGAGGYLGVAPEARLVNVKIADDEGRASTLDAIYGIQFAVDHAAELGIRVLNLSFASTQATTPTRDPLDAAVESAWKQGLVVVAAAGNAGAAKDAVSYAPANDPYVITVGATDDQGTPSNADDQLAPWSSRGRTQTGVAKPEVLAPGAHIVSTLATGSAFAELCPSCVVDRTYFRAGGTSMSAAVVSGVAALVLQAHPDWTPDQVKAALIDTADNVPGTGSAVRADAAIEARPDPRDIQSYRLNPLVNASTGELDYSAASWRAASWRVQDSEPGWAAASWRCDCSLAGDGSVEPAAASWRAASWRVSFTK